LTFVKKTTVDPERIETFVAAARDYLRRTLNLELDGSETSLAYVDHYIEKTRSAGPLKDEVLALVAPALGAYLGQVAIAKFGGKWSGDTENPAGWQVELEPVELRFHPVGMAAEALRQDEVPGYDASFATSKAMTPMLEDALSRIPPVEESYYYSLTGRLETIEHAVDVLTDIQRLKNERMN
jgi:hypothetical protein